jgi:hypothetical protein
MDKSKILVIALLVLIFLGFLHSRTYEPTTSTTTTKTVVVRNPVYPPHYGYVPPPPPRYNPYKAQYYY